VTLKLRGVISAPLDISTPPAASTRLPWTAPAVTRFSPSIIAAEYLVTADFGTDLEDRNLRDVALADGRFWSSRVYPASEPVTSP
jgi:hypothetical protein